MDTLRARKREYTLFKPEPRALMRLLSTDRSDATESAYSVDAGHFQVETDVLRLGRSRLKRQPVAQQELRFNHANLKLGLTHNVDLQVVVESYTVQTEGEGATGTRRAGFGDVTLRLKRNLWGNDGGPTGCALMPFVKLPTGRNCGNGAWGGRHRHAVFGAVAPQFYHGHAVSGHPQPRQRYSATLSGTGSHADGGPRFIQDSGWLRGNCHRLGHLGPSLEHHAQWRARATASKRNLGGPAHVLCIIIQPTACPSPPPFCLLRR